MNWLGDEGVVIDGLPHSPMQTLMIEWVGSEQGRFFFHLVDHPDLVEDLYRALCKSREPLYEIAAKSPADIVLCGDNVDGLLVNPKIFEKYFLPEYEKEARILHAHGKLMAVHMDGGLRVLKDLIGKSSIDIVEGFHPPPMGDLPISESLSMLKDKVIWMDLPGSIYALGPQRTAGSRTQAVWSWSFPRASIVLGCYFARQLPHVQVLSCRLLIHPGFYGRRGLRRLFLDQFP